MNLGASGVSISPSAMPLAPQGFVAAMQAQVAGGGAVEILADPKTDVALIREVANRVTAAVGGAAQVRVQSFYAVDSGRRPRRASRLFLRPNPAPAPARRRRGDCAASGIYRSDAARSSHFAAATGTRYRGSALTPGRATRLADLGAAEILGNTHYFRQDVNFLLPDDWLLLASQKAEFTLHYGFSADLAEGALLLVKVNGPDHPSAAAGPRWRQGAAAFGHDVSGEWAEPRLEHALV